MKKKDIVFGIITLAVLAAVVYFVKTPKNNKLKVTEVPTPSIKERIEGVFNVRIPEDVDKAELRDVGGGDASGIATRKTDNGVFVLTILADLDDPEDGFYQGWLKKGEEKVKVGSLRQAKGGYILEYSSSKGLEDYNTVVVSLEKDNDQEIGKVILEGSF